MKVSLARLAQVALANVISVKHGYTRWFISAGEGAHQIKKRLLLAGQCLQICGTQIRARTQSATERQRSRDESKGEGDLDEVADDGGT